MDAVIQSGGAPATGQALTSSSHSTVRQDSPQAPATTSGQASWQSQLPADLTYEKDGRAIPIAEHESIAKMKDVGTLAKSYLDAQSELGRRVRIPGKFAREDERRAFAARLADTGFLPAVPESPDKYDIAQPDYLPQGLEWNEGWVNQAREVFHKHGFTQAQVKAAIGLHEELVGSIAKTQIASAESGIAELRREWGADFAANAEYAARAGDYIFGPDGRKDPETAEFFARTGLANDPRFIKVMATVGRHLEPDDGFVANPSASGARDADEEAEDIMRNPSNPKHELWKRGDPKTVEYIRGLFARKYPEKAG
jgi:hypothetical protein